MTIMSDDLTKIDKDWESLSARPPEIFKKTLIFVSLAALVALFVVILIIVSIWCEARSYQHKTNSAHWTTEQ
jgi:hypothetical protein